MARRPRGAAGPFAEGARAAAVTPQMALVASATLLADGWSWFKGLVAPDNGAAATMVAAALTALVTIILAAYTLCRSRRSSQDDAALRTLADLRTPSLISSLRYLRARKPGDPSSPTKEAVAAAYTARALAMLKEGSDRKELEPEKAEAEKIAEALNTLSIPMESLGLLVYEGVISIAHVDHVMGSLVTSSWSNVKDHVGFLRKRGAQLSDHYLEWYEWLADRLDDRARRRGEREGVAVGAYVAFKDWASPRHWRWREAEGRWCCILRGKRKSQIPLGMMLLTGALAVGALYLAAAWSAALLASMTAALVAILALLVLLQAPRWPPAPARPTRRRAPRDADAVDARTP